jgi:hypothetical protein
MPEPGNNARNDLPVPVLTDQHMGTGSTIAERNHQLLRMPEGQNDMPTLLI